MDKSLDEIASEIEQLGFDQDRYLREHGWNYTSNTPGCFWLWTREWDGKVLAVSKELALRMQHVMEEYEVKP